MNPSEWLSFLGLAFFLGAAGQLVRVAVGLKKLHEKSSAQDTKPEFDASKFWISIVLGVLAGLIVAISQWNRVGSGPVSAEFLFTIMASGYAGSDIIEGLIEKTIKIPKSSDVQKG